MHPMKRVGLVVLALVGMLGLLAPVGVTTTSNGVSFAPQMAQAACADKDKAVDSQGNCPSDPLLEKNGGPVCIAVPILAGTGQGACPKGQVQVTNDPKSGGAIVFYLKLVLKLINGLVGAIIILMLVIAGVQYIISAGDPANVKSAKNRVMNAIIALVLYMMMFAIINFLVPGGIL